MSLISTVTIFGYYWKLNKIWHVFPICGDLKPKSITLGRGLGDHLFWILHFIHEKQSSRGANLGVELNSARKMGLCKDFKYWQSSTHNNYCYNSPPHFIFQHCFGYMKRVTLLGFFFFFYPVSNTALKSTLLIWKNNLLLFNTFWFNVDITNCLYSKCLLYFSKNILIFSSAWKFQLGKQTIKNVFLFQKVLT